MPHDTVDGVNGCGEFEGVEEGVIGRSKLEVIDGCLALGISWAVNMRAMSERLR